MSSSIKQLTVVLLFIMFAQSVFYSVTQGSVAMISRLGYLQTCKGDPCLYQPGLHIRFPLIDNVIIVDARLQNIDVPSSRVLTEEQKSVDVDYYVKWRVNDFKLYYTRTAGDLFLAKNILTRKVNDLLRAHFGDKMLVDVISNSRQDLMEVITEAVNKSTKDLGVEVVDVRIKSIDYPDEVTLSVYQRMKTQREQVAKMHRANGHMRASEIQSEAKKEGNIIKANASMESAFIRAKANEEASLIANKAYGQNPKFYKFWRMLDVYKNSLNGNTLLILDPRNEGGLTNVLSVEDVSH